MHAATSSSGSSSSSNKRAPKLVPHSPANCAYGFILDEECLRHWTKVFYDKTYGPEVLSSMSPEEAEEEIESIFTTTSDQIPTMVYKHFPHIPRLRRRLVLMSGADGRWLLVLKDNSSQAMLTTKIAPEDVEGVRKLLDLGEQKPMWYRIPSW